MLGAEQGRELEMVQEEEEGEDIGEEELEEEDMLGEEDLLDLKEMKEMQVQLAALEEQEVEDDSSELPPRVILYHPSEAGRDFPIRLRESLFPRVPPYLYFPTVRRGTAAPKYRTDTWVNILWKVTLLITAVIPLTIFLIFLQCFFNVGAEGLWPVDGCGELCLQCRFCHHRGEQTKQRL